MKHKSDNISSPFKITGPIIFKIKCQVFTIAGKALHDMVNSYSLNSVYYNTLSVDRFFLTHMPSNNARIFLANSCLRSFVLGFYSTYNP